MDDQSAFITNINGRHTLVKPPMSKGLRSGSVSLAPGEAVGEHVTEGREEAIVVLTGTATVVCEGKVSEARERQFVYIPPECVHNIINNTKELVEYVYVVTPVGAGPLKEHSHVLGEKSVIHSH